MYFLLLLTFTYFDKSGQVDLHGIVMLRVLSMLQKLEEELLKFGKLGWRAARMDHAPDIFRGVYLSME